MLRLLELIELLLGLSKSLLTRLLEARLSVLLSREEIRSSARRTPSGDEIIIESLA